MTRDLNTWLESEWKQTERLKRKAWALGIDVPNTSQWWWNDDEINMEAGMDLDDLELNRRHYFTEEAKARLEHLFEDAETKREDARLDRLQKRVSVYTQIGTMIVGLGGVAIGIIATLRT